MQVRPVVFALVLGACGGEDLMNGDPDAGPMSDGGMIDPGADSDGDGLSDAFELAANLPSVLDPALADTDGDGTGDEDEDPDGDGLTNLEEQSFARLGSSPEGCAPSPVRKTIVVELDSMVRRRPDDAVLEVVAGAFTALHVDAADGSRGAELCVYRDEEDIAAADLDGDPAARAAFLAAHGPRFGDRASPRIPYGKMVHAMIVTRRTDSMGRGGDTLLDPTGDEDRSGILIYHDALDALHPACGAPGLAPVTLEEAIAGSLVHELGHTLQLGHDTEAGGGVNHWNVMSLQSSCAEAQMRTHGHMNQDAELGNTEDVSAPRFSRSAAMLMRFDRKISADVSDFDVENGREM